MRKFILATFCAASIPLSSTPAAAQPYGQSYGYNGRHHETVTVWVAFEQRLDNVRRSLGGVRPDRVHRLAAEANRLDRRLRFAARNNASAYEVHDLDSQIGQLERRVARASRGDGHDGYNGHRPYGGNDGHNDQRYYSDHGRHGPGGGNDGRGDDRP